MKFSTALRTWFCSIFIFSNTLLHGQNTMFRTIGHQIEGSEGRNVIQAADGGYFMSYYIYYASKTIGCLTKLNCGGIVEWERFYEEGSNALPVDIIPQPDNGCLLLLSV